MLRVTTTLSALRRLGRPALLFAFFALWTAPSAAADGDSKDRARAHFARALELVDEGSYREAIVEFERAQQLRPHFTVLFNLGQVHVLLAEPVPAVDYLSRYLQEGGDEVPPDRRAAVENEIKRQQARIASLQIHTTPTGASIFVDGTLVGTSPLQEPVRVALGDHVIEAKLESYAASRKSVTVAGGDRSTIEITLTKERTSTPLDSWGAVVVDCPLPDVRLRVDGRAVGTLNHSTRLMLPVGVRKLEFEREGYHFEYADVLVRKSTVGRSQCRVDEDEPQRAPGGSLELRLTEPNAAVRVDGKTWQPGARLPVGRHRVVVTKQGFRDWHELVSVPEGGLRVDVALEPTSDHLRTYVARAQRQRTWAYTAGITGAVLGVAATTHYFWNSGRHDTWEEEQALLNAQWSSTVRATDLERRQAENDELLRSVQRADGVTWGLAIAGAAALGTGVVLYVTGDDPGRYDRVEATAVSAGAGARWVRAW